MTSEPKMESGFEPADSANLPRVDCFTLVDYFVTLTKPEIFTKKSKSSEECYGDDAIGYVQLAREAGLCTLIARVCPKPQVQADVKVVLHEIEEVVEFVSIQCESCEIPNCCLHGTAFLLWLHRRSEEPSFRHRECYWRKPWMAEPVKFITAKELSGAERLPDIESAHAVVQDFLSEATKRNLVGSLIRCLSAEVRETGN